MQKRLPLTSAAPQIAKLAHKLELKDVRADRFQRLIWRLLRQALVGPGSSGSTIGTSRVDRPHVSSRSGAIPRAAGWL